MKRTIFVLLTVILAVIFFLCINRPCQAEQTGKLQQRLTHYVNALQSTAQGSAKELELREKIIKLAQRMQPPPEISMEAKRYMVRGQAAIEESESKSDYLDAVKEFRKAVSVAPWWADAYFNLGVAHEKAEQYSQAIKSLKFYVLAAPDASDVETVQTKIFKLEYKMEKASRTSKNLYEKSKQEKELSGTWRIYALKQSYHYKRPPMEKSGWYLLSNGSAKIAATESEFEAVYTDRANNKDWYIFRGKIEGNSIYGEVSEFFCNSAPHPFEGKISEDNNTILLIIRGSIFLPDCKYKAGSYGNSVLLER